MSAAGAILSLILGVLLLVVVWHFWSDLSALWRAVGL